MRAIKQILLFVVTLVAIVHLAHAQTWTLTSAPNTNWQCIASSADGSKLAAICHANFGGGFVVYTSTNSGFGWQQVVNGPNAFGSPGSGSCIASSADGSKLAAAFYFNPTAGGFGGIFISTNSGIGWTRTSTMSGAWGVNCSADGIKMGTVFSDGAIYTSTNSGTAWIPGISSPANINSIAASADWAKLATGAATGGIFVSTNSGATWALSGAPSKSWIAVVSSTDGSKLAAVAYSNTIYTSVNSGVTWISNNLPVARWSSVASSADGTKLIAAADNGYIYTTTNSGITWKSNSVPTNHWSWVASSADGTKLAATAYGGGIYTSYTTPKPSLLATVSNKNLTFSWIMASTNFVLQKNANLAKVNSWVTLTNTPVLNLTNLQNQIILSSPGSNVFYRLKTP